MLNVNNREVIRRLIKYALVLVVVGFAAYSIPTCKLTCMEVSLIALSAAVVFCVVDMTMPTISIKTNCNEESNHVNNTNNTNVSGEDHHY